MLRQYKSEDVPALKALWLEVFDEKEEMVDAFFAALPRMGSGIVAEADGVIAAAGYTLNAQVLVDSEAGIRPLGLIYGIAVKKEYRSHGLGAKIVKAVSELSAELGAEIICCEPAEASLVDWYEKIMGLKPALYRESRLIKAESVQTVSPLSAGEYFTRREALLDGREHVRLSAAAMAFEESMLKIYDGAFMAVGEGIAAAYMLDGTAIVRELLCPQNETFGCAAAAAAALGAKNARVYSPSDSGEAYILSDKALPSNALWNLSFN